MKDLSFFGSACRPRSFITMMTVNASGSMSSHPHWRSISSASEYGTLFQSSFLFRLPS